MHEFYAIEGDYINEKRRFNRIKEKNIRII